MADDATQILVVDDERFFREAIRDVVTADGLECRLAATGAEALAEAEAPEIGVVVLDIQLPDRNGLDVLRRIREVRPALRVVVLSAHTDQEYVLEALRLGACDYLAKPLHEEELRLSVRRALEAYQVSANWSALRQRLAALARELEALATGAEALGPVDRAQRVAEAAGRLVEATKTSVLLLDPAGAELRPVGVTGRKQGAGELDAVPLGKGVAGFAVARYEPVFVRDLGTDARFAGRTAAGRYKSNSFVVVPIGPRAAPRGAVCATDRRDGGAFEEQDLLVLRLLAQAALPWLEASPAASVPAPDEGPDDAELARRVCDAVVQEVEPERLLGKALAAVGESLGASVVSLHLPDTATGDLVRQARWPDGSAADRPGLPRGRGLTGSVFETGLPVATERPQDDPRFVPEVDTPEGGRAGPMLVLPMRFRGKTLGVLRAFLPEGTGGPSARTAEVLGAALSAAVRTAFLYRSLVDSIEEVARARREAQGRA